MKIRPADPGDAARLTDLLGQLGYDHPPDRIADFLVRTETEATTEVFVAEQGGQVIGLMSLVHFYYFPLTSQICRITALVVDEAERSGGVGTALVDHALARAGEAGCLGLEVTTSTDRITAQAYDRKLGFTKPSYRYYKPLD